MVSVADPPVTRPAPARPPRAGRSTTFHSGQLVAAQVAAALPVSAIGRGPLVMAAALASGAAVASLALVRLRQRWLYQWCDIAIRYLGRRRSVEPGAGLDELLDLAAPGTRLRVADQRGEPTALLDDGYGLVVLVEVGDPAELVIAGPAPLPDPSSLVPAAAPGAPAVRVQLVAYAVPAGTVGTAATSYRQLTEGRVPGRDTVVLAVRVERDERWTEDDVLRALHGTVRKVRRRLAPTPARPLGEEAARRVLAEASHHDGAQPVREAWSAVAAGGLLHATYRLRRWPDLREPTARRLVPRLLALPAAATAVAVTARPDRTDLVVRLSAPDPGALHTAGRALGRLLDAERATARRLDGGQLAGFAAALPLGGEPGDGGPAMAGLELFTGGGGLVIGVDRHGAPVVVRLFRPEPTSVALVGGVRAAQLIALRALAVGARVVVQTQRPEAWDALARGVGAGEPVVVLPLGRALPVVTGSPLRPVLLVVDAATVARAPADRWSATLAVRDELPPRDAEALGRADLVVLQPLRPDEAALAGSALGLGEAAQWLPRIRHDMVGVVNRRSVRWALLSATPIETQLIGAPGRG